MSALESLGLISNVQRHPHIARQPVLWLVHHVAYNKSAELLRDELHVCSSVSTQLGGGKPGQPTGLTERLCDG